RIQDALTRTQHLANELFRVRRSRQNVQTLRQRLHLTARDLLGSAQRFFGAFAFRYIDDRTHELDEMSRLIANGVTDRVDVLNGTARMNNSVVCFEVRFLGNRYSEQFSDSVLVLSVQAPKEFLESRRPGFRMETKQAICLVRPVPDFARSWRPGPTPGVAQPLCFSEISFALASSRLRQFSLDGDACQMSDVSNRVLLQRTRAPRFTIVHGKR